MNLLGTARATQNEDFRDRVQSAVLLTAIDLVNDGTKLQDAKHSRALSAIQHPEVVGRDPQFLWFVAANAAIASSVQADGSVDATDGDIQYVVAGAWDVLYPKEA